MKRTARSPLFPWAALALLLAAGLPAVAAGAPAYDPAPQYVAAPSEKEQWVGMIRDAREVVESARARLVETREAYGRMRHTNKARGEKREEIREAYEKAQRDVEEAEKSLTALLERARRAGIPPGWVREALEGFEVSPANQS